MAHVLITNDDGYEAPGLAALYRAVSPEHRVSIVAPADERSSTGHSATLGGEVRVSRVNREPYGEVFAVEGTPVDCVRLAVSELVAERIDHVVSGINLGANVSVVDAHCSGTVAAAREAVFLGIPGVAVSQMFSEDRPVHWRSASELVRVLLPQLMGRNDRVIWNVNLPASERGARPLGVRTVPLSRCPVPLVFRTTSSVPGDRSFEYGGRFAEWEATPGSDLDLVTSGYVTVTPLSVDPTAGADATAEFNLDTST